MGSRVGLHVLKKREISCLCRGVEPLDRPARSLVTTLTLLPQLRLNLKLYFETTYECKQRLTCINEMIRSLLAPDIRLEILCIVSPPA